MSLLSKCLWPSTVALTLFAGVGCEQPTLIDPVSNVDGIVVLLEADGDTIRHRQVGFNETIQSTKGKTIVVDFWASWCGPCRMQAPELEKLAKSHADDVIVLKVDVDSERTLSAHFQISSIPDLRFFRDGAAVGQQVGFSTAEELAGRL